MVLAAETGIEAITFRQKFLELYQTPDGEMKTTSASISEVITNITEVITGCIDFI